MSDLSTTISIISKALAERGVAISGSTVENPLDGLPLEEITGHNRPPAVNMAAKAPDSPAALRMEQARIEGARNGSRDRSARRMAAARRREERRKQINDLADDVTPLEKCDPQRVRMAWTIAVLLHPEITRVVNSKRRWAARFLGDIGDDVIQMTVESIVTVLARSDRDLDQLAKAALDITGDTVRSSTRKWLLGMVHNRVMGSLVDAYQSRKNLRWENIDLLTTVMTTVRGGDDPLIASTKADRSPAFLTSGGQAPGRLDWALVAEAISAAITDRKLDPLVEVLLDERSQRTDGSIRWTELAETIFLSSPQGAQLWPDVVAATRLHDRPGKARADAARAHVRNLFEWLPELIVQVKESFDIHIMGWAHHPVLGSDFDAYLRQRPRLPLRPALSYASPADAAQAIRECLGEIIG